MCDQPCQLPGCSAPTLTHKTRTCTALHDRGSTKALCATPVPLHYLSPCARSPSKPTSFGRSPRRAHRASCRAPSACTTFPHPAHPPSALPGVKLGTGASVFASPVLLSSSPATPTHDLAEVADGSHVPVAGSSLAGSSPLLTAPPLSEALLPQSATEARGALTVLLGGQLQLLSTASSQPLPDATRAASPALSTTASSGEYFLPACPLCALLPSESPPASCAPFTTKTASAARYYTSKLSILKDLVLYWHVGLGHASEQRLTHTAQHQLTSGLPSQLTAPCTRKYFKRLPRCVSCATATLQQSPDPPPKTTPPLPGHSLYTDFAQPSGSPDTSSPSCVKATGGYTHALSATDLGAGRALSFLTKSTKGALSYLVRTHKLHLPRGHTLVHLCIDSQLATTELRQYCTKRGTRAHAGVPYEHQSLGTVERFSRTIKESKDKKVLQSHTSPSMWGLADLDSADLYSAGPSPAHDSLSPYRLYDGATPDATATPLLP